MKFNVMGKQIKIVLKSMPIDEDDPKCVGLYIPEKSLIYVSKDESPQEQLIIAMHEILHALIHRCGLSQTSLTHDNEEIICEVFSNFIIENFLQKTSKTANRSRKKSST